MIAAEDSRGTDRAVLGWAQARDPATVTERVAVPGSIRLEARE
jgi:hypothetical protein